MYDRETVYRKLRNHAFPLVSIGRTDVCRTDGHVVRRPPARAVYDDDIVGNRLIFFRRRGGGDGVRPTATSVERQSRDGSQESVAREGERFARVCYVGRRRRVEKRQTTLLSVCARRRCRSLSTNEIRIQIAIRRKLNGPAAAGRRITLLVYMKYSGRARGAVYKRCIRRRVYYYYYYYLCISFCTGLLNVQLLPINIYCTRSTPISRCIYLYTLWRRSSGVSILIEKGTARVLLKTVYARACVRVRVTHPQTICLY